MKVIKYKINSALLKLTFGYKLSSLKVCYKSNSSTKNMYYFALINIIESNNVDLNLSPSSKLVR